MISTILALQLPCFPSLFTIPQISQNQHLPFYYLQSLT
ncbi:hypothetical protein C943_01956 [Mariniradius saccharolyticus AK6]|uniref:Uncharacterized protein n=1 Tax=Mariniradius saccharolyticus AK6 TaxID=1239962 RepID=M7X2F4_9BACT|nr:hypothetical protein C943_01956 [Mariniradius saccharolyticus AK6]